MLFTRDLRVHDNPALSAACAAAERVVPLFVLDDTILAGRFGVPNRIRFLLDGLDSLRESLRESGGDLVVRRGDPVAEVAGLAELTGARSVFLADDRSHHAARRLAGLRDLRLRVSVHPGVTVVPPGELTPVQGDHYKVFTPYWRAWHATRWRPVADRPKTVRLPEGVEPGPIPGFGTLTDGAPSPDLMTGGERAGRRRVASWLDEHAAEYDAERDDLAADTTSRLSAYLRFGCVSPLELAVGAARHEGFRRQLAWRDFHHQVAAAFPDLALRDYRARRDGWHDDAGALAAWRDGLTGCPIVDAGMRQLRREGFMHNRARMITASYLTRNLFIDWRHGYAHFNDWLADGDIANNAGNWQWVAGTGNDTRPNRVMSPLRQAARFDPLGEYVKRYVPELGDLTPEYVHRPWELPPALRRTISYPPPVVAL